MQTYTSTNTNAAPATGHAPADPLLVDVMARGYRRRLAAALRTGPVRRETTGPSAAELQAARDAVADPRSTQDRVLDAVVDRLMRALAQ